MIVTVPTASAVTIPDDDTVTTPVLLNDQFGVTVAVVPSLYVAVALTDVVVPTVNVVDDTLTDKLDTVAVGTTTLISNVPLRPSCDAMTVTVPTATAVTVPACVTVATAGSLVDQMGITVAVVPSLYVAVAITAVVAPIVNVVSDARSSRLVTVSAVVELLVEDEPPLVGVVGDPGWPPQLTITAVPTNRTPREQTPKCLSMQCRRLLFSQLTNSILHITVGMKKP